MILLINSGFEIKVQIHIFLLLPFITMVDMEEWRKTATDFIDAHVQSFDGLNDEQIRNFIIKKDHSFRVAKISEELAQSLELGKQNRRIAWLAGLFHDIGRFSQLVEYSTFNDVNSANHAEVSVDVLKKEEILRKLECNEEELIYTAIRLHNKFELPKKLSERELLHARLLRDADKLDIYKVITDYYTVRNSSPNHTLTWDLPRGTDVSPEVRKEALAGKLVTKKEVVSEMDVKIMQLSWVYDINFKPTFEYLLQNRFLEKIYNTLPKKDIVIDIYRKVKVFAENKLLD